MYYEECEEDETVIEKEICEAISFVSKHYPLSKFKKFISQFLLTENTEDQWTYDYESYAMFMYHGRDSKLSIHPTQWAYGYYRERWDLEKERLSMLSIKNIAVGD